MNHVDLFTGIGGFSLAASWVWSDHRPLVFCEQGKYCQQVLKKHWPDVPVVEDVRDVEAFKEISETVDLVTGGFPCQPFSTAGKRDGTQDVRYLWPEMREVIKICRPRWVLCENVTAIDGMALDAICDDLECLSYEVGEPLEIPALATGSSQIRMRVWIVAHSNDHVRTLGVREGLRQSNELEDRWSGSRVDLSAHPWPPPIYNRPEWDEIRGMYPEFILPGMADGLPNRVHRRRALGNCIVPYIAAQFFHSMKTVDEQGETK